VETIGSSLLGRATKSAVHKLLDWRWTRDPVAKLGRYVYNRWNGDNDADMATNGEDALIARLAELLGDRPAVLLDVGANLGEWTRAVHRRLGPEATVYAFEPVASIHAQLERNVRELGKGARVIVANAALGDADGSALMRVYGGGASSFHDRSLLVSAHAAPSEEVRCTRGDTFCREHGIERIDFVKIDVEGHELAVLQGFETMLAAGRIDALQFEYGGAWIDSRTWLRDAFDLLMRHGYAVGKVVSSGIRWLPRYEWRFETFQYANYVAARPELRTRLAGSR
jgi:FkbM family methyltransferase